MLIFICMPAAARSMASLKANTRSETAREARNQLNKLFALQQTGGRDDIGVVIFASP
jgi:hypothetical protein